MATVAILLFVTFLLSTCQRVNREIASSLNLQDGSWARNAVLVELFTSFVERSDQSCVQEVSLKRAKFSSPTTWLRLPIVWIGGSGCGVAAFVWSTKLVETAISAVIFELWPIFLIIALSRQRQTVERLGSTGHDSSPLRDLRDREQFVLVALGGIGLVFMLGSQVEELRSFADLLSLQGLLGIALALVASVASALSVAGSIAFGRIAWAVASERLVESQDRPGRWRSDDLAVTKRTATEFIWLWFSLLGVVVGWGLTVLVTLCLAVATAGTLGNFASVSLGHAILYGSLTAGSMVFVRIGNIRSSQPEMNAVFFVAPVLALLWLLILGVHLTRFDLFIVGATLILAINILLQRPDVERDARKFGRPRPAGIRFGLTSYIISIWVFGTMILLRDGWTPAQNFIWAGVEYWGLLGLSATVYSLILGFGRTRLQSRVEHEDELMFRLFRDCGYLVRSNILGDSIFEQLARLDTARQAELLRAYNECRQAIGCVYSQSRGPMDDELGAEAKTRLSNVEESLDALAHSKQQGQEVVETISLVALALITIGIGLLSRPFALGPDRTAWSGFLTEVFVLVLVSTVAFLTLNLFDLRRARDVPLLVWIKELGDYSLFFRSPRSRTVDRWITVLVCIMVMGSFTVLLFGKWQTPSW